MQAVNDFVLFTVAGGGSLLSGVIYATYGWLVLIYVVSVLVSVSISWSAFFHIFIFYRQSHTIEQMAIYLALFVIALKRRKEIVEAEKAQSQPLLHSEQEEDEDDPNAPPMGIQPSPLHTQSQDSQSQIYSSQPETREDRTFSDFINSFAGGQKQQHPSTTPLLVGGPASVGGILSAPLPPPSASGSVPMRTISTNQHHQGRTFSISEVLTTKEEEDDDLRPVRSMSVV